MKAYHFLMDDMRSGCGDEAPWKIGEEREIKGEISLCERGYHSSPNWYDAVRYAPGNIACIVKVSKPVEKAKDKQISRKRKLLVARNAEKVLRSWACDCAERALKKAKITEESSWNAITVARLYNEGKASIEQLAAARAAALYAAWAAASDAAWDVARDVARATARIAARNAARDAAWAAARADAWAAARAAAWAVARDAEVTWQKRRLNWHMKRLFSEAEVGMVERAD